MSGEVNTWMGDRPGIAMTAKMFLLYAKFVICLHVCSSEQYDWLTTIAFCIDFSSQKCVRTKGVILAI